MSCKYSPVYQRYIIYCGLFISLILPKSTTAQCTLSCNDQVNVALSPEGFAVLTPDLILEGEDGNCDGDYAVQIMDSQYNDLGDTANCAYLNQLLTVKVIHTNSGSFCWGNVLLEDKLAPTLTCPNDTINCNVLSNPVNINAVLASDNCDADPDLSYYESTVNQQCDGMSFNAITTRIWTAMDAAGNLSASCVQNIYIRSASLTDVDFPVDADIDASIFNCEAPYPLPEITGEPEVFGDTISPICKINTYYNDLVIDICENSYKVRREWTALNCCTNETLTNYQWITVMDTLAPNLIYPDTLFVGTNESACSATILFPPIVANDNCSNTTINATSVFGGFEGNTGAIFGVPLGTHNVNITATDACGNEANGTAVVVVTDDDGPIVICDELTTVSITTSSIAEINAAIFDDGSYDYCCEIDSFRVRRMDSATGFLPTAIFTCDDVSQSIMTIMRAYDCKGNFNECMVEVEVQDKLAPSIVCPADMTLNCEQFPSNISLTGEATATDNCEVQSVAYQDVINLTSCNVGTVIRTWTATDVEGLLATCTQLISYVDTTTPVVVFPENDTLACTSSPEMVEAGEPILQANCAQLAVAYFDDIFPIVCGFKVIRTWQVMDWCSDFMATGVQEIIIMDNQPPDFDQAVGSLDVYESCGENVTSISVPTATDACGSATVALVSDITVENACLNSYVREISYTAEDDCGNVSEPYIVRLRVEDTEAPSIVFCPEDLIEPEFGSCTRFLNIAEPTAVDNCGGAPTITNNSPFALSNNGMATGTYPLGETIVTYYATDACGNVDSCAMSVLIEDISIPSMACNSPLVIYLQDTVQAITVADIDNGSTDACSEPLSFSIDLNKVDCQDVGSSPTIITLTGIDQANNMGICMATLFVLDTMGVCGSQIIQPAITAGSMRMISGDILANMGINMEMNGETTTAFSDENGNYYFYHDYTTSPCVLRPYNDDGLLNGVTTYDMVLITRHILSTQTITSPYRQIAADINNTGSITTADVVALRRSILGIQNNFPNNTSWRFVPVDFEFSDTPFSDDFPESIWLENPPFVWTEGHFIAIKIGDINGG